MPTRHRAHPPATPTIPHWLSRSLGESRASILAQLGRDPRTIEDLAAGLDLSRSAVRSHLAQLEQAALVERLRLPRETRGKPAYGYRITSDAAIALSTAYAPLAAGMLSAVSTRFARHEVALLLRTVGRALAVRHASIAPRLSQRLADAALAFDRIGGRAEVLESGGRFELRSGRCPLGALTSVDPFACETLEAFVAEIAGAGIRGACEHGAHPRCRFQVTREDRAPDASGDPGL